MGAAKDYETLRSIAARWARLARLKAKAQLRRLGLAGGDVDALLRQVQALQAGLCRLQRQVAGAQAHQGGITDAHASMAAQVAALQRQVAALGAGLGAVIEATELVGGQAGMDDRAVVYGPPIRERADVFVACILQARMERAKVDHAK